LIPIAEPQLGPEEEAEVREVIRHGALVLAEHTPAFEQRFAMTMGAAYGVATCSGTSALHVALMASGIGPADEVITSSLTFTSTVDAIALAGARPIFADVDSTLNLSSAAAARLIGPRTKAIVLVHLHGNPGDLPAMWRLAKERGLALIQVAREAAGATINDEPLGVFGTAVYSIVPSRADESQPELRADGGMMITTDAQFARTAARLRNGYDFQMSEMQAAIGTVQLRKLAAITERRRQIAAFYDRNISSWYTRPWPAPGRRHVYSQYALRVPPGWSRDEVRLKLQLGGIATGVLSPPPLHLQPPILRLQNAPCPVAEQAATELFSIPMYPSLSDDDCTAVAAQLNRIAGAALPF
jgi:dTDP-4-amino-4,6-dideoxygalactose transaminase